MQTLTHSCSYFSVPLQSLHLEEEIVCFVHVDVYAYTKNSSMSGYEFILYVRSQRFSFDYLKTTTIMVSSEDVVRALRAPPN